MKRLLISCLVLVGLSVSLASPSHAILGLSACDKVKKEIRHEESIGLLYYKDFSRQRQMLLKMDAPQRNNMADVLSWVSDVYVSDQKVYAIVEKNAKCFSAKEVISARKMSYGTTQSASEASYYRVMYANKNEPMTASDFKLVKDTYSGFYSFLNPKKLVFK